MNIELAERVRGLIRKYPERHDQETWASEGDLNPIKHCGTSACIAGWVAAAKGFTLNDLTEAGHDVEYFARDALGITSEQANALFYNFNNREALGYFDELIAEAKVARDERVVKA